jgi:hypothetical protein
MPKPSASVTEVRDCRPPAYAFAFGLAAETAFLLPTRL